MKLAAEEVKVPDVFSRLKRSEVMRRIKSKDTKPELLVRRSLHKLGYRYRLHVRELPGKPDIVLPKHRAVIQVRGCFWHQHNDPACSDSRVPGSRKSYWEPKLKATVDRDRRNDDALRQQGWRVVVVWECACASEKKLQDEIQRVVALLTAK